MKLAPSARDVTAVGLALALVAVPIGAQTWAKVPWGTGESLEYTVKLAGLSSGNGIMQVIGIDTVRGRASWHLHFNIKGSTPLGLYHVNDSYDSWMDAETLNSLRFQQDLLEGGKKRLRNYEIFPDLGTYQQEGKEERASSASPLDDASFFFFVRTLPLEVGQTYTFDKYFNPDANPVVIKVVRKDTIDVPAGRFPAIVLQPTIKTNGLFSKNGHAEIWLSDDEHRILLRMDTHFSFITLGLQLRKVTYGSPPPDSAPGRRR
ncbi:MAG: DUF3108 domain-containing protein [Gemmatimonadaceae bacterium]